MNILNRALLAIAIMALSSCGARTRAVKLVLQPPSTNNYPSYFASWLGFYKEEGVDVAISQVAGASKVLEAVIAGSADVGGGVYEQTIQMAADGKAVVSFVSLLRSPNFAIIARPGIARLADLEGKTVGVSSVGSPSQFYLNYLLTGNGVTPNKVSSTGVGMGATAMAALDREQVDAAVLFGSAIPEYLARNPNAVVLADARTATGLRTAFGVGEYPASCLLAQREWIDANHDTAKRIAHAVVKSLAWLRSHSAEEVWAKIPGALREGDDKTELDAIRLAQPMYSSDGRISLENAEAVRKVLAHSLPNVRAAQIDLSKTFTNELLQ